ncbi:MAG: glycosyltransferase family 2 protein [Trebonia sp.]|jgi:glycosyltransferase involved in cell wall biosynthesis
MPADLSVVICSLNGAAGVDRCLRALAAQKDVELQIIVVDDGSTDDTSDVAREHCVTVFRHEANLGASVARNTGIRAATAPVVAFLDDDCEPEPEWARELLMAYSGGVIGVGGPLVPESSESYLLGFLQRNNPLLPLEMNLAHSEKLLYRLYLYVLRQWAPEQPPDLREVYTLVGANMSFLRDVTAGIGFDERFRFGAEDLDVCLQLRRGFPGGRLVVTPSAVVRHHFDPYLRDTLRRSRAYGRGCAMLYLKWPTMRPTIFPGPVLVGALLAASIFVPFLLVVAVLLPQLLYPAGLRLAVTSRRPGCLLDPYVRLAQETYANIGYLQGLWRYRGFDSEPAASTAARLPQETTAARSLR